MAVLSIIVPVYNKESYLKDCVTSILKQTFHDFELILVNDGSTDYSGQICDAFHSTEKRVKVIHQHNQGVSAARNAGIALARGDYVGFVDADDVIEAEMYEVLLRNARKHEAQVSICQTRKFLGDARAVASNVQKKKLVVLQKEAALESLLNEEISGSVCDKLYSRIILQNLRFSGSIYEDVYFNFQTLQNSNTVVYDSSILYSYLVRSNSVSMSKFNENYMNIFTVSQNIKQQVINSSPVLINCALRYQFVLSMFLLNLILLTSAKQYQAQYDILIKNLHNIFQRHEVRSIIKKKHLIAYRIFCFSPRLYSSILNYYSILRTTEMRLRT